MGSKPSNNFQSNRPESGGADRDDEREKSGLLDREKEQFATARSKLPSDPAADGSEETGKPARDPAD